MWRAYNFTLNFSRRRRDLLGSLIRLQIFPSLSLSWTEGRFGTKPPPSFFEKADIVSLNLFAGNNNLSSGPSFKSLRDCLGDLNKFQSNFLIGPDSTYLWTVSVDQVVIVFDERETKKAFK